MQIYTELQLPVFSEVSFFRVRSQCYVLFPEISRNIFLDLSSIHKNSLASILWLVETECKSPWKKLGPLDWLKIFSNSI